MKKTITIGGLITIFCIAAIKPAFATGKPFNGIKINYTRMNQAVADTTLPVKDEKTSEKKEENATGKKEENATRDEQVEVVKVIPKARKQPIPVPVKVNVQAVKVIKPKIKAVVKPVIKILH